VNLMALLTRLIITAQAGSVGKYLHRFIRVLLREEEMFFSLASVEVMLVTSSSSHGRRTARGSVHAPGFDLRHVKYIVDEVQQVLPVLLDQPRSWSCSRQISVQPFQHDIRKTKMELSGCAARGHVGKEGVLRRPIPAAW